MKVGVIAGLIGYDRVKSLRRLWLVEPTGTGTYRVVGETQPVEVVCDRTSVDKHKLKCGDLEFTFQSFSNIPSIVDDISSDIGNPGLWVVGRYACVVDDDMNLIRVLDFTAPTRKYDPSLDKNYPDRERYTWYPTWQEVLKLAGQTTTPLPTTTGICSKCHFDHDADMECIIV